MSEMNDFTILGLLILAQLVAVLAFILALQRQSLELRNRILSLETDVRHLRNEEQRRKWDALTASQKQAICDSMSQMANQPSMIFPSVGGLQ